MKLALALQALCKIKELKADWDDEGALPVSEEAFKQAKEALYLLAGTPVISACADGSVDFYWSNDNAKLLLNFPRA